MKILILGACCSCNLGDAVICGCVEDLLRKRFPDSRIEVRDLIRRNAATLEWEPTMEELDQFRGSDKKKRLLGKLGIDRWLVAREEDRVKRNLDHIRSVCAGEYDLAVFAGGQMFMDRYALFLEAAVKELGSREVPVFFNACGTGPDDSSAIRTRLKKTLSARNVVFISCRDDIERVKERYLEQGKTALPTHDPGLLAGVCYGVEQSSDADTVGLGVIYPHFINPRKTMKLWQEIILELERRERPWQLFTNGDPADICYARQLLASMPQLEGREGLLLPRDRRPEELVANISTYKSLIAYRLHSHIIAASMGIPSVALVWDGKLRHFFEKIGHPERCFDVSARAKAVVDALEKAEREGIDRAKIAAMGQDSARQLIAAIEERFHIGG